MCVCFFLAVILSGGCRGRQEGHHHLRTVPSLEGLPQDPDALGARAREEVQVSAMPYIGSSRFYFFCHAVVLCSAGVVLLSPYRRVVRSYMMIFFHDPYRRFHREKVTWISDDYDIGWYAYVHKQGCPSQRRGG